jgi:hypothetical protein
MCWRPSKYWVIHPAILRLRLFYLLITNMFSSEVLCLCALTLYFLSSTCFSTLELLHPKAHKEHFITYILFKSVNALFLILNDYWFCRLRGAAGSKVAFSVTLGERGIQASREPSLEGVRENLWGCLTTIQNKISRNAK